MRALEQRPGPGAAVLARSGPVWRPARRGDLDALRALVVVGPLAFRATWGMPLLFVISGMGVWYSLGSRGTAGFAREQLRRLGVPLPVGLLTLVRFQVWLGQRRAGDAIGAADLYTRFWSVRPSLSFPFLLRAAPDGGRFETASDVVLAFYLLHEPVVVAVAYVVLSCRVTRFLFGLKPGEVPSTP
jgi:hypothetical protein